MTTNRRTEAHPKTMKPDEDKNLLLWRSVGVTDPKFTRNFQAWGRTATTIDKHYCWLKMTRYFGPCGIGWGAEDSRMSIRELPNGDVLVIFEVRGWYRDPETTNKFVLNPGYGSDFIVRKDRTDDDAVKKAYSDALTNSFKYLGMSADVYLGLFDDDKYVEALEKAAEKETTRKQSRRDEPDDEPVSDDDERDNRTVALDMMELGKDPGEDVFKVNRNGTVVFEYPDDDDATADVRENMITLIRNMPGVKEIGEFAAKNEEVAEYIAESLSCLNPINAGAYEWARLFVKDAETLAELDDKFRSIIKLVNPMKKTNPHVYDGIRNMHQDRKKQLKGKESDDGE